MTERPFDFRAAHRTADRDCAAPTWQVVRSVPTSERDLDGRGRTAAWSARRKTRQRRGLLQHQSHLACAAGPRFLAAPSNPSGAESPADRDRLLEAERG